MKSNILKLVLILIILPLQSHASSMTEKEFIQSMFDYTNQQNNLTKQIAIQAKNKNIAQGAKLTCLLKRLTIKKIKFLNHIHNIINY